MLKDTRAQEIDAILAKYPSKRSAVMPLLYLAQEEYGYCDEQAMREVAELTVLDPTEVKSIVGFYTMFFEEKTGQYVIEVCDDLPCALRGADEFVHHCEQKLGIPRPEGLQDVDGFMAVRLWWEHEKGDKRALPALLRYNIEDAVNLHWLMETAYNLAIAQLPVKLPVTQVPVTPRPYINWPYDPGIIRQLMGTGGFESHWSAQPRRW